jgi:hypothetical protein
MGRSDKPRKVKADKFYTRKKSEYLLSHGADLTATFVDEKGTTKGRFRDHPNYHVRRRCWELMGRPLPEDATEREKFFKSIHMKDPVIVEAERLKAEADCLQAEADAAELARLALEEQAQAAESVAVAEVNQERSAP